MSKPIFRAGEIGAREAQEILEIGSTMFHRLIEQGRLPARMHDRAGGGFRRWIVKRADVLKLKAEGARKNRRMRPRPQHAYWERYFGPVPEGYMPVFRDGNPKNSAPENLCLMAKKKLWLPDARGLRRPRACRPKEPWTREMLRRLRNEYAGRATADLARDLGRSIAGVRMQVRRLKLRKSRNFIREHLREHHAARRPIGAERVYQHTDTIYVKVSPTKWRPKHHLLWEQANGRPVPTRNVIFKDGNRRNFAPANLVALTMNETSALTMLRIGSYPKLLQDALRLASNIRREANRQIFGGAKATARTPRRKFVENKTRWIPEMDAILYRDYPHKLRGKIAANIGVSESSVFNRARRLKIQRMPETIMAEARARARDPSVALGAVRTASPAKLA